MFMDITRAQENDREGKGGSATSTPRYRGS